MNIPKDQKPYDAIVIGAGVAGAAIVKSIKNNDIESFLVVDGAPGPGCGTSGHGFALCHPYIGRGASRLQRLTMLAFKEAREIWTDYWSKSGVLHLPREPKGFDKKIMSERLLSQGFNAEMARPLEASESLGIVGASLAGTFFPEGGWVNLKKIAEDHLGKLQEKQKRWSCVVTGIQYKDKYWHVYGVNQELIGSAKRIFLANGLGARTVAASAGIELPLKPVRGQLSTFSYGPNSTWAQTKPVVAISGKVYCLPPTQQDDGSYHWSVGSTYDENEDDLVMWKKSHLENQTLIQEMFGDLYDGSELKPIDAFVGIRCVAKDRLPVMGPVKGHPGLYVLTALGSRGVMWSALACQMYSEHLTEELRQSAFFDERFLAGARLAGAGLSDDLASALLPARFLAGASNSKPIFPSA
ncbi:tRNA 5-methylaminomethyl-2-thiouridine biosynthesis bifunctional protein [Polynucleobacter victoriensis]|uniref:tRNA 5-methylaminomethyl-2-thiouridine biosynthesis bifunctional protein n=1 Tax=Polynucleobacter victoriensis TaxID=2049319 RepID=A0A212TCA6_9BURK|nr:tRNA 5-methylaminomethyl-2-thiouridine biosynthesis bifunctional protein [Polynucleobacter victoriensis]